MRSRGLILSLATVVLIAAGVVLVAYSFLGFGSGNTATNSNDPAGFNVPEVENTQQAAGEETAEAPEDKTLKVTVPKMARIKDSAFPDAAGDDEETLKQNAGLHLRGTGFPWQEEANVYLAGHRLGYPN